jgi:hypothetical protein
MNPNESQRCWDRPGRLRLVRELVPCWSMLTQNWPHVSDVVTMVAAGTLIEERLLSAGSMLVMEVRACETDHLAAGPAYFGVRPSGR